MKSNELRIGNIVEYRVFDELAEPKEEWVKNVVDLDDLKVIEMSDNYRPMKLTGELLRRFGFEEHYEGVLWTLNNVDILEITKRHFTNDNDLPIESVHQLQNLYFAFTGDELKLL